MFPDEAVVGTLRWIDWWMAYIAVERLKGLGFGARMDPSPQLAWAWNHLIPTRTGTHEVRIVTPVDEAPEAHAVLQDEGWLKARADEE